MSTNPWRQPEPWQQGPIIGGAYTFMRVPPSRDLRGVDVAIVGLPFDAGTTYRPGARFGPRGIRDASGDMLPHPSRPEEAREPFRSLRVVDYGDLDLNLNYIEVALRQTEEEVYKVASAGALPLCLGGDHALTLGILRALHRLHGTLSLLLLDAHPEFWEPQDPQHPYNHGTWLYIAVQEGLVDPRACVQVGIRGSFSASILGEVVSAGITVFTAAQVAQMGVPGVLEKARAVLRPPLYISIDIDCADPAFAPATGVPEVAGLTSREMVDLVRGLRGLPVVGLDLMEVAPPYDHAEVTSILAANLVYQFLLTRCPEAPGEPA